MNTRGLRNTRCSAISKWTTDFARQAVEGVNRQERTMFSKEFETALNQVAGWARSRLHEFITVEHLLLALLDEPVARDILRACDADLERLREELQQYLNAEMPVQQPGNEDSEVKQTLGFQRVIQRAVFHVQSTGKREVSGA